VLIVKDQLEDYRTVIKYVRQQSEFDGQRLVVWGSSFSGLLRCAAARHPDLSLNYHYWIFRRTHHYAQHGCEDDNGRI
jgi:hypothetical protein